MFESTKLRVKKIDTKKKAEEKTEIIKCPTLGQTIEIKRSLVFYFQKTLVCFPGFEFSFTRVFFKDRTLNSVWELDAKKAGKTEIACFHPVRKHLSFFLDFYFLFKSVAHLAITVFPAFLASNSHTEFSVLSLKKTLVKENSKPGKQTSVFLKTEH